MQMYADIIVDITNEKLDRIFQYSIPSELRGELSVGTEVIVPFGNGNREISGYVVSFSEKTDYPLEKIKPVLKKAEKSVAIESKLVALAAWMKEQYGGTMIQALKTVLPIKRKESSQIKRKVRLLLSTKEAKEKLKFYQDKNQKARARLLAGLIEQPEQDYELVTKKLNVTLAVIRSLKEQGVLALETQELFRGSVKYQKHEEEKIYLNEQQQQAAGRFWDDYSKGIYGTYLVYGITGSGKTEVYIEMIRRVIGQGRQVIVLIPEIALTYQTVLRFYSRFGDRVSVLNSRMSAGERYDQMERVKRGEVDVMIGPRSALFTPFGNLGLIVVDEEHESTYKSEQVPRYHARETAIARAKMERASVVLGSATPSLEAFFKCRIKDSVLLRLTKRAAGQRLPTVHTVDMREELKSGNRSIISDCLKEKVRERLKRGQQTMLFINRRGYAGFVSCRSCGYVVKCPHCDVSLSEHKGGKMVCHYCGHEEQAADKCPCCGSDCIGGFKAGTQQIEDIVKREFTDAVVLRMDMDTTKRKDSHAKILSAFSNGEADILIGTQMIVKGHDFPNVTLVGILAADMSLYSNDYRSGERTFELLTQAAGRAGRGEVSGEVVIQTYSPEHYSIRMAAKQDYEGFYEEEMRYRELMGYPPVSCLLAVLMTGADEEYLRLAASYLKGFAVRADKMRSLQIIGPASPYVNKVNDEYRRILYLKCGKKEILIQMKDLMEQYIEMNSGFQSIRIQFDLNPMRVF